MIRRFVLAILALASCSAFAQAGLFRTYLASTGSDANPCTRQAPCRLLPAALAATADGGEIWMLDSANYNTATVLIGKSVNILAVPGALGSMVGNASDAIEINGAGAKVSLRNLVILNLSGGGIGVRLTNGASLRVEACEIYGFATAGLSLNAPAEAVIIDTVVRDNVQGIVLDGGVKATLSRSHVVGNSTAGISVAPNTGAQTSAFVSDSVINDNGYGVFMLGSTGHFVNVHVRGTTVSGNANSGFYVQGFLHANDAATLHLSTTAVNRNATGIEIQMGQVISAGDNRVLGNTVSDRNNVNNSGIYTVAAST